MKLEAIKNACIIIMPMAMEFGMAPCSARQPLLWEDKELHYY